MNWLIRFITSVEHDAGPAMAAAVQAVPLATIETVITEVPVLGEIEAALPPDMKDKLAEGIKAGAAALVARI